MPNPAAAEEAAELPVELSSGDSVSSLTFHTFTAMDTCWFLSAIHMFRYKYA